MMIYEHVCNLGIYVSLFFSIVSPAQFLQFLLFHDLVGLIIWHFLAKTWGWNAAPPVPRGFLIVFPMVSPRFSMVFPMKIAMENRETETGPIL